MSALAPGAEADATNEEPLPFGESFWRVLFEACGRKPVYGVRYPEGIEAKWLAMDTELCNLLVEKGINDKNTGIPGKVFAKFMSSSVGKILKVDSDVYQLISRKKSWRVVYSWVKIESIAKDTLPAQIEG